MKKMIWTIVFILSGTFIPLAMGETAGEYHPPPGEPPSGVRWESMTDESLLALVRPTTRPAPAMGQGIAERYPRRQETTLYCRIWFEDKHQYRYIETTTRYWVPHPETSIQKYYTPMKLPAPLLAMYANAYRWRASDIVACWTTASPYRGAMRYQFEILMALLGLFMCGVLAIVGLIHESLDPKEGETDDETAKDKTREN